MNMPSVTIDQVMQWRSDISEEDINALFAGRERVTVNDIAEADSLSYADRVSLILQEDLIPPRQLYVLSMDYTEHAIKQPGVSARLGRRRTKRDRGREPQRTATEAKRAYLRGEITVGELRASQVARTAAWAASSAVAWAAARASEEGWTPAWASAAAWAAARASEEGWTAAWASEEARTAAWAAAWAAIEDESRWQVEHAIATCVGDHKQPAGTKPA